MFERLAIGWRLGIKSWSLLQRDRELMWLPLLAGVSGIGVFVVFGLPGLLLSDGAAKPSTGSWVLYALAVFGISIVSTFCFGAVVAGATERLHGGDPTLSSAWGAAWNRRGALLRWAALSTIVALVIRVIEERFGFAGRIVGWLAGASWSIASAFAVPVIMEEDATPGVALKRSAAIIRERWGQTAGSIIAVNVILLPAVVLLAIVLFACIAVGAAIPGVVLFVLGYAVVLVVGSTLSGIARAAMYQYATTGASPLLDDIDGASLVRTRKGRALT